jgi:hypothetical protein
MDYIYEREDMIGENEILVSYVLFVLSISLRRTSLSVTRINDSFTTLSRLLLTHSIIPPYYHKNFSSNTGLVSKPSTLQNRQLSATEQSPSQPRHLPKLRRYHPHSTPTNHQPLNYILRSPLLYLSKPLLQLDQFITTTRLIYIQKQRSSKQRCPNPSQQHK